MNAMVHVIGETNATLTRRKRSLFARPWLWVAIVGLFGAATLLVPDGLSAPASIGWDGWRPGGRADAARIETGQEMQDAVAAGQEVEMPLFPCRAVVNRELHVGRIRPDFAGCHIAFDGREVEISPYETLAASWRPASDALTAAFVAGSERTTAAAESPFETGALYLCRAAYQGGIHAGQAKAGEKGCSFGFGGKRIVATSYDVLQAAPWLTWVRATARNLPDTAILSGTEGGEAMYACRAADRDGLHPGKIKRNAIGCSIVSEGHETISERFEVLATRWMTGRAGTVPVSAYAAGRENGSVQFVCRATTRDSVQVGKVNEALGGCHVGMLGREVVIGEYEVLAQ